MEATLSPEMNGCVSQITSHLASLDHDAQLVVLREVSDRLEDLRAKRIFDEVSSGEMETHPSKDIMANLKAKYDL
jgi:hypothetical protein